MEIQGKTIIVTGAARGIGRAIAEAFAGEGANLVLADLGSLANKPAAGWHYRLSPESELAETAANHIGESGGSCVGASKLMYPTALPVKALFKGRWRLLVVWMSS